MLVPSHPTSSSAYFLREATRPTIKHPAARQGQDTQPASVDGANDIHYVTTDRLVPNMCSAEATGMAGASSARDTDNLFGSDEVEHHSLLIQEYNRLAKKCGFHSMVVEDALQSDTPDGVSPVQQRKNWWSRAFLRRTSATSHEANHSRSGVNQEKSIQRKLSVSDLAIRLVGVKKCGLMDEDVPSLIRLCGKSPFYLPSEYAAGPLILPTCLRATGQYLVYHGPYAGGVFRIPGSVRIVNALYDYYCIDQEAGDVATTVRSPSLPQHIRYGVHDVASTFKKFLAGLPGGLLGTADLFEALAAINNQIQSDAEVDKTEGCRLQARLIALCIGRVGSRSRRDLICAVFGLLSLIGWVAETTPREGDGGKSLSATDLMGYSALGIIFGPLLIGDLFSSPSLVPGGYTAGTTVSPVTSSKVKRERQKSKPAEEESPATQSLDKIIIANRVAEMVIRHWREVVRHIKNLGISPAKAGRPISSEPKQQPLMRCLHSKTSRSSIRESSDQCTYGQLSYAPGNFNSSVTNDANSNSQTNKPITSNCHTRDIPSTSEESSSETRCQPSLYQTTHGLKPDPSRHANGGATPQQNSRYFNPIRQQGAISVRVWNEEQKYCRASSLDNPIGPHETTYPVVLGPADLSARLTVSGSVQGEEVLGQDVETPKQICERLSTLQTDIDKRDTSAMVWSSPESSFRRKKEPKRGQPRRSFRPSKCEEALINGKIPSQASLRGNEDDLVQRKRRPGPPEEYLKEGRATRPLDSQGMGPSANQFPLDMTSLLMPGPDASSGQAGNCRLSLQDPKSVGSAVDRVWQSSAGPITPTVTSRHKFRYSAPEPVCKIPNSPTIGTSSIRPLAKTGHEAFDFPLGESSILQPQSIRAVGCQRSMQEFLAKPVTPTTKASTGVVVKTIAALFEHASKDSAYIPPQTKSAPGQTPKPKKSILPRCPYNSPVRPGFVMSTRSDDLLKSRKTPKRLQESTGKRDLTYGLEHDGNESSSRSQPGNQGICNPREKPSVSGNRHIKKADDPSLCNSSGLEEAFASEDSTMPYEQSVEDLPREGLRSKIPWNSKIDTKPSIFDPSSELSGAGKRPAHAKIEEDTTCTCRNSTVEGGILSQNRIHEVLRYPQTRLQELPMHQWPANGQMEMGLEPDAEQGEQLRIRYLEERILDLQKDCKTWRARAEVAEGRLAAFDPTSKHYRSGNSAAGMLTERSVEGTVESSVPSDSTTPTSNQKQA